MNRGRAAITSLLYLSPDAEAQDKAELRRLCQRVVSNIPTMQTAVGQDTLDRILAPINATLASLTLEEAEKHITRF